MTHMLSRSAMLAGTALAFGVLAGAAHAQTAIQGEGSSLASPTYTAEFGQFTDSHYSFSEYSTSSGKGQAAVTNNVGTATSGVPAGLAVDWGASDSFVNSTFQSTWNSTTTGLPESGQFIQIPLIGVAIAVPFNNPAIKNGPALKLTDSDLCGIFSGKITTWDGLSGGGAGAHGAFNVYYRADGSGTSFLLTQHLAAPSVCNASNSNITFSATTTFASLFANNTPPSNFFGETGSSGVATAIQNDKSSLGYLSPDYTNVVATPAPGYGTLNAASVVNATSKIAYQPTYLNTAFGLSRPGAGATNKTPPNTATTAANQLNWVPALPVVTGGYPVVGYTNWLLPTCFADTSVGSGLVEFLTDHFNGQFNSVINSNGFVTLGQSVTINGKVIANPTGAAYVKAIDADFLANPGKFNLGIDNTRACTGHAGRPNHSGS